MCTRVAHTILCRSGPILCFTNQLLMKKDRVVESDSVMGMTGEKQMLLWLCTSVHGSSVLCSSNPKALIVIREKLTEVEKTLIGILIVRF